MPSVSWIVSFSLLVISFLGIVFASMFFAKPVDNYKVSFMRMFPFEMPKTAENNGSQHEGALTPHCIVQKKPPVSNII